MIYNDQNYEDNLEIAENTIQTNIDSGMLNKNTLPKLPNLRDGLALSYAAANNGNSRAATKAREAAYTESEPPLKDTGIKLLSNELPSFEKMSEKTKYPTSFFAKKWLSRMLNGKFRFYNSDTGSTLPKTWEEYFEETLKANEENPVIYSSAYRIKK